MAAYAVRLATAEDAAAIARIYNQGIEDRTGTLETQLRTPEERREWLAARGPRFPVIVAELAERGIRGDGLTSAAEPRAPGEGPPTPERDPAAPDAVIGWGSLNVFNAREAYRFVADFSVYIERAWRGKGVGSALLGRLVELAREHGFHKLVLSTFPWNSGGIALYTKLGFRTVGTYREQGLLDGRWVDTTIMERLLDGPAGPPAEPGRPDPPQA